MKLSEDQAQLSFIHIYGSEVINWFYRNIEYKRKGK
jgi:hypothetical protein